MESYLQETGKTGRDRLAATAILYFTISDSGQINNSSIKEYCKNKIKCRIEMLLKYFDRAGQTFSSKSLCAFCDL